VNLQLFFSTFVFIFLASLPGRTTFLMILMAARARPWSLFFGAILAFGAQSLISVMLGSVIALFPAALIHFFVALLFFFFSYHFWRTSQKANSLENEELLGANTIRTAFLVIFAGEWGDVSQVAIASISARSTEKMLVFLSALTALWSITAFAVLVGSRLGKVVNPTLIQKVAAVGFALVGAYLLWRTALDFRSN
jgi:putative Ca2+/H+ antiporter (TMEM165/GDT1 family)